MQQVVIWANDFRKMLSHNLKMSLEHCAEEDQEMKIHKIIWVGSNRRHIMKMTKFFLIWKENSNLSSENNMTGSCILSE